MSYEGQVQLICKNGHYNIQPETYGHQHVTSEATYSAPSPEQTQYAQHRYEDGKLVPVNPKNFKVLTLKKN